MPWSGKREAGSVTVDRTHPRPALCAKCEARFRRQEPRLARLLELLAQELGKALLSGLQAQDAWFQAACRTLARHGLDPLTAEAWALDLFVTGARAAAPDYAMVDVFVCPVCELVSQNPHDAAHGYCGACHAVTRRAN
jgi:hypothetical protein